MALIAPRECLEHIKNSAAEQEHQVDSIRILVPHLDTPELIEEAVAITIAIRTEGWRADAIALLARWLPDRKTPPGWLHSLWTAARRMKADSSLAKAIPVLGPLLTGAERQEAVARLEAISVDGVRAAALMLLAAWVEDPVDARPLLQRALDQAPCDSMAIAYQLMEDGSDLQGLSRLFIDMSQSSLERFIELVESSGSRFLVSNFLLAAAPFVPQRTQELFHWGWVAACSLGSEERITAVLSALPVTQRRDELAQLLRAVRDDLASRDWRSRDERLDTSRDKRSAVTVLAKAISFLPDDLALPAEIVPACATGEIDPESVERLGSRLTGTQLKQALDIAVGSIGDIDTRIETLTDLLPGMRSLHTPRSNDIRALIIDTYLRSMQKQGRRYQAFVALLKTCIEGIHVIDAEMLERIESALTEVPDAKFRKLALNILASAVGRTTQKAISYRARISPADLDSLLPNPSELGHDSYDWNTAAKETAMEILSRGLETGLGRKRSEKPLLSVDERFRKAMEENALEVAGFAHELAATQHVEALKRSKELGARSRFELQVALLPYLEKSLRDSLIDETLRLAAAIRRARRQDIQRRLVEFRGRPAIDLVEREHMYYAHDFLADLHFEECEDALSIAKSLSRIIGIDASLDEAVSPELEALIRYCASECGTPEKLVALAQHLPADVFQETLAWAVERRDRQALEQLAPYVREKCSDDVTSRLWNDALIRAARDDREQFLSDLRSLAPMVSVLGKEQAVEETCVAIRDVGRWWP